jgi:hypothetical protein
VQAQGIETHASLSHAVPARRFVGTQQGTSPPLEDPKGKASQVAGRAFRGTVKATASPPTIALRLPLEGDQDRPHGALPWDGSKEVRGDERNASSQKPAKGGL